MKRYQMEYKISKEIEHNFILNILGKDFVKYNINKGKLIIENKKYNLMENIQLNNFKKSKLKIDILLNKDICLLSCMFKDCESLFKFSINDKTKNKKINYDITYIEKNDNEIAYNINKLDEEKGDLYESFKDNIVYCKLSEISKKEESSDEDSLELEMYNLQIIDKSEEMIYKTESLSLSSLYDKLYFINIIDMSFMFCNCELLLSLPDISKWNTNHVIYMEYLFYFCKSLLSLPDISK